MAKREKGREEDILKAAAYVFAQKGFHKATIEEIAEEAGVGKGTVYEYFTNKDSLFVKTLEYNLKLYHSRLKKFVDEEKGFIGKLYRFIDFHSSIARENIRFASLIMQDTRLREFDDQTRKGICEQMKASAQNIMGIITEIFGHEEAADRLRDIDKSFCSDIFYFMVIRKCGRSVQMNLDHEKSEKEKKDLVDMFLNGIMDKDIDKVLKRD